MTLASGDRTWHALAWEANARIVIVEGNLLGAHDCIVKAVAAVENFDAPLALAAWGATLQPPSSIGRRETQG